MNLKFFQKRFSNAEFDEIKVIGKDIKKENRWYHIIGMGLRNKQAFLYALELTNNLPEEEAPYQQKTHRASLKGSMEEQKNPNFFMRIREFQTADKVYETAGANAGPMRYSDCLEEYLLFFKMKNAGWTVSPDSPFYEADFSLLSIINIEFRDEFEQLPDFTEDMQVLVDSAPESCAIELPVFLECGKAYELHFSLTEKKEAVCYINKVYLMDIWEEETKKFSDSAYKERMLSHMTEPEFEEMKQQFFTILEEHCPKGSCYLGIEYECTEENVSLDFYDTEYLDTIPEPHSGSATALLMRIKPDNEIGPHGFKQRGAVIQKPLSKETDKLKAELFSYHRAIEKRIENL